jgi:hypothetical protein
LALDLVSATTPAFNSAATAANNFISLTSGVTRAYWAYSAINSLGTPTKPGEDGEMKVARAVGSFFFGGLLGGIFGAAARGISGGSTAVAVAPKIPAFNMPKPPGLQ